MDNESKLRSLIRLYQHQDWRTLDRILDDLIEDNKKNLEVFDLEEGRRKFILGVLFSFRFLKDLPKNIEEQIDVEDLIKTDPENKAGQSEED